MGEKRLSVIFGVYAGTPLGKWCRMPEVTRRSNGWYICVTKARIRKYRKAAEDSFGSWKGNAKNAAWKQRNSSRWLGNGAIFYEKGGRHVCQRIVYDRRSSDLCQSEDWVILPGQFPVECPLRGFKGKCSFASAKWRTEKMFTIAIIAGRPETCWHCMRNYPAFTGGNRYKAYREIKAGTSFFWNG